MVLYYHMPYVQDNLSVRYPELRDEMQKLIDSADCIHALQDPISRNDFRSGGPADGLVQGYVKRIFPPGSDESIIDKIAGSSIVFCFYDYKNIKMREVKDRKEAFAEINRFLSVNKIDTQYTLVRTEDAELRISLWGESDAIPGECDRVSRVSFVLRNDDTLNEDDSSQIVYDRGVPIGKKLTPSKPNKYLQKYFDSIGGDE